jgi:DNA-binding Xre family transcriptional regulator
MSRADLRKSADISSNTLTRVIKDETVTLELLSRICNKLDCDFGDIVTYVSDSKTKNSTIED